MLVGLLENRGNSTMELSVKDAVFAANSFESPEEFFLCESWKGSTGAALWAVLSRHA